MQGDNRGGVVEEIVGVGGVWEGRAGKKRGKGRKGRGGGGGGLLGFEEERLGRAEEFRKSIEMGEDNSTAVLNEMGQKGIVKIPENSFRFEPKERGIVGGGGKWCCVGVLYGRLGDGEGVGGWKEFKRVADGRSKKEAKKLCARMLLDSLKDVGIEFKNEVVENGGDGVGVVLEEGEEVEAHGPDHRNCIGQLDQLYRKELLLTKPKYSESRSEEAGGKLQWQCDVLVQPKDYEQFCITISASTKKKAKNVCASQALERLVEMGLVEAEDGFFKKKEVISDHDDDSVVDFDFAQDNVDEAIENVMTDDNDLNGNFMIRKSCKVFVAECEEHCDQWIAKYIQQGEIVGTYIDCYDMRQSFKSLAQKEGIDVNVGDFIAEDCKTICFSTAKSVLLVSAYAMRNKDEKACWIPSSVKRLLETKLCTKSGIFMDEGAMTLYALYGIQCLGLNDLNMASACVKGIREHETKVTYNGCEMVREWLNVGFTPFGVKHSLWNTKIPREFRLPAVLMANVCVRLRLKMNEKADEKHLKRFPNEYEYSELYNNLCTSQSPIPARKDAAMVC